MKMIASNIWNDEHTTSIVDTNYGRVKFKKGGSKPTADFRFRVSSKGVIQTPLKGNWINSNCSFDGNKFFLSR